MTFAFEQFAAQRRMTGNIALSTDGSEVAYIVDTSGQFNVWKQSVNGGWPHQLTLFDAQAARGLAWSPHGDLMAIMADEDGAERYQLFLVPSSGGVAKPITSRPDVQYSLGPGAFSPGGSMLMYSGNELIPENNDVFIRDLDSGSVRPLVQNMGHASPVNWSPDDHYVTVCDVRGNTDIDIYLVDVETGSRRLMTEHQGNAVSYPGPWLHDSSAFYLISDIDREFKSLALCQVETGQIEWIATPDWDVEAVDLSRDGQLLMWAENQDGLSKVHVRDLASGHQRVLQKSPSGTLLNAALVPDGSKIVLQMNNATAGINLFAVDVASGDSTQITFGMLGGLPPEALVEPELVHFPTFDDRTITAWLYRPHQDHRRPIPVVLSIHGGPESQERPEYRYSGLYQYLTHRGVAVLAPNIRGSTGYGKTFQSLIHHDWGGGDLTDLEHAVRYLQEQSWTDNHRIGVFGGSYGGFATLSCVTRLPQYWAAAAEIVGPSNLVTFARSVPPTWRRNVDKWVGNPDTESEFLMQRSPITYVEHLRCPLLIIQGANDYRVVRAESDQMVDQIRAHGGTVEYVVVENEGHGFTRRSNQIRAFRTVADFLLRHLDVPG